MERLNHGFDQTACPLENLMDLDERDKEWVACVIKKVGGLFRDDQE